MKTTKKICAIACIMLLAGSISACSVDSENIEPSAENTGQRRTRSHSEAVEKERMEEETILMMTKKMIEFENNRYAILVSEDEAVANGVSKETYRELCKMIQESNKLFEEIEKEYKDVVITDGTLESPLSRVKMLASGPEVKMPTGTIRTYNGQSSNSNSVSRTPYNMTYVYAHCYGNGISPASHTVKTYTMGSPVIRTRLNSGYISVDINASNTPMRVEYSTTDPRGGVCAWEGK